MSSEEPSRVFVPAETVSVESPSEELITESTPQGRGSRFLKNLSTAIETSLTTGERGARSEVAFAGLLTAFVGTGSFLAIYASDEKLQNSMSSVLANGINGLEDVAATALTLAILGGATLFGTAGVGLAGNAALESMRDIAEIKKRLDQNDMRKEVDNES